MTTTVAIEQLTLQDLEQRFGLQRSADPDFFREWRDRLPELGAIERDRLQRIQASYANLERRSVLENTVKLAVVAPLLDLAGFFLPPFYVDTETSVEIVVDRPVDANQIGGEKLRGRVDILVLMGRLWVLAIESKRAEFSVKVGIPQVLGYMLAAAPDRQAQFGLVTNGSSFVFLKLAKVLTFADAADTPLDRWQYDKSPELILDRADDLATVLQVMKKLGAIVSQSV
ncbi:MAG: restriction endonuclease subunit R [Limnothrix sp. CACIAM 69d]|nr:MAG: restriction endonuclease subunit R [Limnothrix sp. CACIAM 69d]